MQNRYSDALQQEMDRLDLNYDVHDLPSEARLFALNLPSETVGTLLFILNCRPNGQITYHVQLASGVTDEQAQVAILRKFNRFHNAQRYLKFSLDEESGNISAEMEFLLPDSVSDDDELRVFLFSMVVMCQDCLDQYLPELLPLVWKAKQKDRRADISLLEHLLRTRSAKESDEADEQEEN